MRFMCVGTWRDVGEEGQRRMLEVFENWKPPTGLQFVHRWVTPAGMDFMVVDVESTEVLAEAVANWAPFIAYAVHPITEAETAFPGLKRAVLARVSMAGSR